MSRRNSEAALRFAPVSFGIAKTPCSSEQGAVKKSLDISSVYLTRADHTSSAGGFFYVSARFHSVVRFSAPYERKRQNRQVGQEDGEEVEVWRHGGFVEDEEGRQAKGGNVAADKEGGENVVDAVEDEGGAIIADKEGRGHHGKAGNEVAEGG